MQCQYMQQVTKEFYAFTISTFSLLMQLQQHYSLPFFGESSTIL